MTTGDFKSDELLVQERGLRFGTFETVTALALGNFAMQLGLERNLPIAIEVRFGEWTVFKAALPGSSIKNDSWIERKARVVNLTHNSTMYERVRAEELGSDWYAENGVSEESYAIHGGGLPIFNKDGQHVGTLLISGLPQVEDHKLGIEILSRFIAQ